ncbi:MAG: relaxase/mobilization nuclease, partial [Ethanoligenens sp.]
SVSHIDGIRYHRTEKDYFNMQIESDKLCHEYELSVIDNPKRGRSKHYGEWRAEKEGRKTWRSTVKLDVDTAIAGAMTERQFFENLKKMDYQIKVGKDISVRPPGKERFFRLTRNFGEDYAIAGIRKRILAQTRPQRILIQQDQRTEKGYRFIGCLKTARKMSGLRALYFTYLYKMGVLPKKRVPSPKQVYFLFREDIRKMQNITQETRLLCKYHIDTGEQLSSFMDGKTSEIISLYATRKHLRYQARSIRDEEKLSGIKSDISALSEKMGILRREVRLCEDIERRSAEMKVKLRKEAESKNPERKEKKPYEQWWRRC